MQPAAAVARRAARPWVGPLARIGLATKGIVYLLIGVLAVLAATGNGGEVADSKRAVRLIGAQPYGDVLLVLVAIGFLAYALWRALEAIVDLDGVGGGRGVVKRIGYGLSAAVYLGLAVIAIQLALGEPASGQEPRTWVARVLAHPFGDVLVVTTGAGFAIYALLHLRSAITAGFQDDLQLSGLTRRQRSIALWAGRTGTAARGVVFAIIGYRLVLAGVHGRPGETRDVAGALRTLASGPHGDLLLGVIAAGLALYGIFVLFEARLGRVPGADR